MRVGALEVIAQLILCYDNDNEVSVFRREAEDGSYYDDVDEKTVTFKQMEVEVRVKVADSSDGLYVLKMIGARGYDNEIAMVRRISQQLKKAIDARA